MASGVCLTRFLLKNKNILTKCYYRKTLGLRTFLSEAYRCDDAWSSRLDSPILKKIKLDEMFYEIDTKNNHQHIINGIDVDLFVSAAQGDTHLEEMEDLIHQLRISPNAYSMLPSTPYSLIRAFLETNKVDDLLRVLNDRLNYGVFVDHHTANLLMDTFIKNKQYLEAAKVGVLQMLQEDWEHPLTTSLSILSCVYYLQDPKPWDSVGVLPPPPEDKSEEVKVKISYLRNPHFDDHFDLKEAQHLVGKTFAILGPHLPNKQLANSLEVLGWTMYCKWDKAVQKIQQLKEPIIKQSVEMALESISKFTPDENTQGKIDELKALLSSASTSDGVISTILEGIVKDAVKTHESTDIENQVKTFKMWESLREEKLVEQIKEIDKIERMKVIEEKKKYLQEKEDLLYFFENEDQWDLKIEANELKNEQNSKETTKKEKIDLDYVPPEVHKLKT